MPALVRPIALLLLVVGCAAPTATPHPTPGVTATPVATAAPAAAPTVDTSAFVPLPRPVNWVPRPGDAGVGVDPRSVPGLPVDPALGHPVDLGHCGLLSPVDIDGSLWVAAGAHNGSGGLLTEEQLGELINATPVRFFLVEPDLAVLVTPAGAEVLLARHPGRRAYPLCD